MAKAQSTKIQTYLFDREKWTPSQAISWLRKKDGKTPKTVTKEEYLHYRQKPPFMFKKGSFRTITLSKNKGIKAVIGKPRNPGNPTAAKKIAKKKPGESGGKKEMAAKKKKKKSGGNPGKTIVKYRTKQTVLGGINVTNVAKDIFPLWIGAMICKFTARRFVSGGEDQTTDWSWKNYGLGVVGTLGAALLSAAVFKGKGRIAQNILAGGLLLTLYKLFMNEVVYKSQWMTSWFGQEEDIYPDMSGYTDPDEDEIDEGDLYQDQDQTYAYGQDLRYRPVNEMHRSPAVAPQVSMGVDIEPRDPTFGVDIEPRDPTFGATLEDRYKETYTRF